MYKAILFDLDGTILHSISDITTALNISLKTCGYDFCYDDEGTKKLIGMGAYNIVARVFANRQHTSHEFERLLEIFSINYKIHQGEKATPYQGVITLLNDLKTRGIRLFVASNKPDHLAKIIVSKFFGNDIFEAVYGHEAGKPEKPHPYLVSHLLATFHLEASETLFVGDSDVDVMTANNSNLDVALVTWGYGNYIKSLKKQATYVVDTISELESIVMSKSN